MRVRRRYVVECLKDGRVYRRVVTLEGEVEEVERKIQELVRLYNLDPDVECIAYKADPVKVFSLGGGLVGRPLDVSLEEVLETLEKL